MSILITFEVGTSDEWLRAMIRGDATVPPVRRQRVIVEDTEADRICAAMANLKHARKKVYGGSIRQRVA